MLVLHIVVIFAANFFEMSSWVTSDRTATP